MQRTPRSLHARVAAWVAVLVAALAPALAHPGGAAAMTDAAPPTVTVGQPASFGDAPFLGSMAGHHLVAPVIGMAADPTGRGYWLVAADGGVFAFGSAPWAGSAGGLRLVAPVVGMAANPGGDGYWLVAADGGVFAYGSAGFYGSAADLHLAAPIVGMAAAPGGGYWLVGRDGGIFAYGAAPFLGTPATLHLQAPVVGMAAYPKGDGYWLAGADGGVFAYGLASYDGGLAGRPMTATTPLVHQVVASDDGRGYWLLPVAPPPPPPPPPPPHHVPPPLTGPVLQYGDTGPAVAALQSRLSALGYWLGTVDGVFGDATEQAVWAIQKAAGLSPDGVVGPSTYAAVSAGVVPRAHSTSGHVIEVDLSRDLVLFVDNGHVQYVLNCSTGGGYTYWSDGVESVAITPVGRFSIYAEVDGTVTDSLGQLYRPKYFDSGFAIHGDSYVPPYPVSHGCVRVSDEAIDWIWASGIAPIGTPFWVYG